MNRLLMILSAGALVAAGCASGDADRTGDASGTGSLVAAFGFDGPQHDVAFMGYAIYAGSVDCADPGDAEPVAGATVPMEEEFLPLWLEADGSGGDMHPFADALFVLQPGDYTACATPLDEALEPSEHCAPTGGEATVMPEMTTEIVLYSQCLGDPTGGLDVVVALNDPPHIDWLTIDESKFITSCEEAVIEVTASDPNGDALTYAWEIVGGPAGASAALEGAGATAVFGADTAGEYTLKVTVSDGHGGVASLSFPVHVSADGLPYKVDVNGVPVGAVGTLKGTDDISTFYSYGNPDAVSANTDPAIEQEDTAVIALYEDGAGVVSLLIILDDVFDDDGGDVNLVIGGLTNAAPPVPSVGDDNPGNDFYTYDAGAGTLDVDWQWDAIRTDGLAVTFDGTDVCVSITPSVISGITAWKVLDGDLDGGINELAFDLTPGDTLDICYCLAGLELGPLGD